MGSFSVFHWLIVLAIVMLIFGTGKLRSIGADLGGAVRGFKEGMQAGSTDKQVEATDIPKSLSGDVIEGVVTEKSKSAATR